ARAARSWCRTCASAARADGDSSPAPARAPWQQRCRGGHRGPRSARRSGPSQDLLPRRRDGAVWRGLPHTILRFALKAAVDNPAGPRAILLNELVSTKGFAGVNQTTPAFSLRDGGG